MDAILKAFSDSERMYSLAKAASRRTVSGILAQPPGGPLSRTSSLSSAQEQLDAFKNWVWAAIRPIADRVSAQPVRIGKTIDRIGPKTKGVDATTHWYDSHPILSLLKDPNDLCTGHDLIWSTVASILLTGRGFWLVSDDPPEIFQLPTTWIRGFEGERSYEKWLVQPPGQLEPTLIDGRDVVLFSMPHPGDPWGAISPLMCAAGAVDLDEKIVDSQRSSFRNGILASYAVHVGRQPHPDVPAGIRPRLTGAQYRQVVGVIRRLMQGVARHGNPVVLDGGLIEKLERISHSPNEMDWASSSKLVKERILEAFGVSPYILGSSEPGSRAASAMAMKHFISGTVNPIIRGMNSALQETFVSMFDVEGLVVEIEPAEADDDEMQLKRMELAARYNVVEANELRQYAGLPENSNFDHFPVAGRNVGSVTTIEQAIGGIVDERMGAVRADMIMENVRGNGRGGDGDGDTKELTAAKGRHSCNHCK